MDVIAIVLWGLFLLSVFDDSDFGEYRPTFLILAIVFTVIALVKG